MTSDNTHTFRIAFPKVDGLFVLDVMHSVPNEVRKQIECDESVAPDDVDRGVLEHGAEDMTARVSNGWSMLVMEAVVVQKGRDVRVNSAI